MSELKTVKVKITGVYPLFMHNGELADPLSPWARDLSAKIQKKKKTKKAGEVNVAMEEEIAEAEWNGGLWYDEEAKRPYIPSDAIEALVRDGAKGAKQGKSASSGVRCANPLGYPLLYDGPRDRKKLFAAETGGRKTFVDRRGAVLQRARIIRTRPRFNQWAVEFEIVIDTGTLAVAHVKSALIEAGVRCGLGDYRPSSKGGGKFGLFTVDKFEEIKE